MRFPGTKRAMTLLLVGLLCFSLLAGCAPAADGEADENGEEKMMLRQTTGGATGGFYIMASGVADYLNGNAQSFSVTPITSAGGGVDNLRRMYRKEAELGFALAKDVSNAWEGVEPFTEGEIRNVQIIGPARITMGALVTTLESTGINDFMTDLKGKRVCPGGVGASETVLFEEFLKLTGLLDDVKITHMNIEEMLDALKNGEIDVCVRGGPTATPWQGIVELELTHKAKLLDLGPAMDSIDYFKTNPLAMDLTIAAGTYDRQDEDIRTYGEPGYYIARDDIPEDVIYEFCKLLFTEEAAQLLDDMWPGHELRATILPPLCVPLHPGAERFWKEQGVEIPTPLR